LKGEKRTFFSFSLSLVVVFFFRREAMNTGKKKNADFLSLLQLIFLRLGASKTPTIRAFSACRPP